MPKYKVGIIREQESLFPARLEDYIHKDNPVRAIDVYIDSLGLTSEQNIDIHQKRRSAAGQPAYSPQTLLKLYLYGYINRVRSSRALEKECQRNVEVMWLLSGLSPCYKTIADFRKDNAKLLRKIHKDFILLCKQLNLLGGERIAIDGSFFHGNVSDKSFITEKGLKKFIQGLDEQLNRWIATLDENDLKLEDQTTTEIAATELSEKLIQLKILQSKKQKKEVQLKQLEQVGRTQLSRTDKDARLLNKKGQTIAGYNVQIATDSKHKLIIADEVVDEPNDLKQLSPMAKKAKEVVGSSEIEVLADAGYCSAGELAECLHHNITPYVSIPPKGKRQENNQRYSKVQFHYDEIDDSYRCPAGQTVTKRGQERHQKNGTFIQRYAASETTCLACKQKDACIPSKSRCREIWRHEHEDLMEKHRQRMDSFGKQMRQRSGLVEHPFGTLKRRAGWDHFLVRGFSKVRGEWSLMAFAYNFTRVLNIIGIKAFNRLCMLCFMPIVILMLKREIQNEPPSIKTIDIATLLKSQWRPLRYA